MLIKNDVTFLSFLSLPVGCVCIYSWGGNSKSLCNQVIMFLAGKEVDLELRIKTKEFTLFVK